MALPLSPGSVVDPSVRSKSTRQLWRFELGSSNSRWFNRFVCRDREPRIHCRCTMFWRIESHGFRLLPKTQCQLCQEVVRRVLRMDQKPWPRTGLRGSRQSAVRVSAGEVLRREPKVFCCKRGEIWEQTWFVRFPAVGDSCIPVHTTDPQ